MAELTKAEALETLSLLSEAHTPLWLAGGLAADFHVGRWTRDHHDIDLVTFEEHRAAASHELERLGFTQTRDEQWISRWTRSGREIGEVSLAYMERADEMTGNLVVRPEGSRGGTVVPGVYPGVPGNLDEARWRTLEDIRFRVVSAEDEWVFTKSFPTMHPGAEPGPTDVHNVALLESVLTDADLERLRPLVGRRISLEETNA